MGRYIPNSTENGIQSGIQMNAQNVSAMRDLQNTKAQAEMQNRTRLMDQANQLEYELRQGPPKQFTTEKEQKDWLQQTQSRLNEVQSGLNMFIDANGTKHYQSNPYATAAVDSGYASKMADQDVIDQAFNAELVKDKDGKVVGKKYNFSNPDTAAYAKTLGITPGMSYDEMRSRIQGKHKDLLDIMGDSYQTNPVVQHYGAYNSPQHNAVKRWGMGDQGLGISYANDPLLPASNEPYLVPGSEVPYDREALLKIDTPSIPTPPIKHGAGYDTTKIPSSTATPAPTPQQQAAAYSNPYTDYLDKTMLKYTPQSRVPIDNTPVMEQSPLPNVSQYQNAYSAVLPRMNYNIPFKNGGTQ